MSRVFALLLVALALLAVEAKAAGVLVFGDSLSSGYGVSASSSWPALLETRLRGQGRVVSVSNASLSGESSVGALGRLAFELARARPDVVIVALGSTDGLRQMPVDQMEKNISSVIIEAQRAGALVILAGMRLPPSYGQYGAKFESSFHSLARLRGAAFFRLPFDLVERGVSNGKGFQADGLHPTAEAHAAILEAALPAVLPLLK